MAPQPQPRSSAVPISGGFGAALSSAWVPRSRCSGLKVPPAVTTAAARPRSWMWMLRRSSGPSGVAEK
ncbi:hypothetical protein ACFPRL_05990 [Pseudoclavibacter helvolus]